MRKLVFLGMILILTILTANLFAVYAESNTWLVSKAGDDTNNLGAPTSDPVDLSTDSFLMVGAAVTAASDGDIIFIWPGTYSESVNASAKKLNVTGVGSNVTLSSSSTCLSCGGDSTYKNLNVNSTNGIGISVLTRDKLIDVNCTGGTDGLYSFGSTVFLIRSQFHSSWDAANLDGYPNFWVEGCLFDCSGTSTQTCHAVQNCATGIYQNNIYKAIKTDTSANELAGIHIQTAGVYNFKNEQFVVNGGSGRTGRVCGIHIDNSGAIVNLDHCTFSTSGSGANGGPLDIYVEAGTVNENGCIYTTSLGTITHGGSGWSAGVTAAVPTAAQIGTEVNATLNTYDSPTKTEMDSGLATLRQDIANDVCDNHGDGNYKATLTTDNIITALISDPCFVLLVANTIDINALVTAYLNATISSRATPTEVNNCVGNKLEDYNSPTKVEFDTAIAAIPTAEENRDAIFNKTGITAAGTWTFEKICKVMAAWSVGEWQDKTGSPGTYQVLDAEDQNTPVVEVNISDTSKYREIIIP